MAWRGELRSWGQRPDERPWQVQLGTGAAERESLVVAIKDGAFATSGDYWHQFVVDGRRYSHTLDPRTGWPVQHDLASVTVFHAECMHADALTHHETGNLSTKLFACVDGHVVLA